MKVCVIGGGAAGMMAAGFSALIGNEVDLYEKNDKLGKKIYITGKGRCNVTNACRPDEFLSKVVRNAKFLTSSINSFTPEDTMELITAYGTPLKIERGNRVFPTSDKSSDIIKALTRFTCSSGVKVFLERRVGEVVAENGQICGIKDEDGNFIPYEKVIIATGGMSYRATGSTGDGYEFASKCGHKIIDLKPSLVGITLKNDVIHNLSGLSLKNVNVSVIKGKNKVEEFGEMLFTDNGVSGPSVLTLSSMINRWDLNGAILVIDLKPVLNAETLDKRLLRDFESAKNKNILHCLESLTVKALLPVILNKAKVDPSKKVNAITKDERKSIVSAVKALAFDIEGIGSLESAVVTSGGVNVKEIDPSSMESKLIKGLYFAGEVIDADALTGGYNLQIAFSTAYMSAKK